MQQMGITERGLSRISGVHRRTIHRLLTEDGYTARHSTLVTLEVALEISVEKTALTP